MGCTPVLKQGDCFQYFSGAQLDTPTGRMSGKIRLAIVDDTGTPVRLVDAAVAPFSLIGDERVG